MYAKQSLALGVFILEQDSLVSATHLKLQRTLGAHDDVLVETLLGVVWQLKRELGAQHPRTEELGPQHLKQHPKGSVHPEDRPSFKIKT